jgi:hypothetical protein
MIMDEPSPINFILPLLRGPVYPDLFLAHPRFLREERRFEKSQEREGLAHGVQAEGIRIILLRRLFFHSVGPVPGRFASGDGLAPSCLWRYFLAGLFLRRIGGEGIRKR